MGLCIIRQLFWNWKPAVLPLPKVHFLYLQEQPQLYKKGKILTTNRFKNWYIFQFILDFVLSSDPEIAYKNVDIVIAIATYEEIPGRSIANALIYQLMKARHLVISNIE